MIRSIISVATVLMATLLAPRLLSAQSSSGTSQNNQTSQTSQAGQTSNVINASEAASQLEGSERFLRENRQVGQMVGGMGQGVGNLRGQTDSASGASQGANLFGGQSQMSMFNQAMYNYGMANSLSRQQQQLRVPLRLGFAVPATPSASPVAVARVQSRLAKIPQLRGIGSVAVQVDGRVAVLRGQVASEHDRDLLTRLVLLEPGISDVRNELQVPTTAAPTP
jgi:osmotically-inducible protein OsmY